jgi:hypothetical protein
MFDFRLHVHVVADETGMALPGLFLKAYDKDLLFDDLLGSGRTDGTGRLTIPCERGDFQEFFDRRPDVYFKVFSPDGSRLLYESSKLPHWNATQDAAFTIRVPLAELHGAHEPPAVRLASDGDDGDLPPSVGDSLVIAARGLAPAAAHDVEVRDEDGPLFVSRLMSDAYGVIESTVLWPQFGLDDPRSDAIFTVDEANERWRAKKIGVRIVRAGRALVSGEVEVGPFDRPLVLNTDAADRMHNAFEDGHGEIAASGYNITPLGHVRVYLVDRQADWRPGDRFAPVRLRSGNPAFTDARADARGRFRAVLARPGEIHTGAYDFVVRPLRYGYEDDDDFVLRPSDVVTRRVTGVVIREDFWQSKVVHLGCVNVLPLAGRPIGEAPYFRYGDAFAEGENVWVALDPAALPPVQIGKMAAIYVVPSKTQPQWDNDKDLHHLAQLGGDTSVLRIKTQVGCINYNKHLVWPNASAPGSYDVVVDFGNNESNPTLFAPDGKLTIAVPPQNGDIIDGYINPGFRVVKDPGVYTDPAFLHVGGFDYVNEGSLAVVDDDGVPHTVPLTARVKFPADVAGASQASQISNVKASYPMTIIVHGMGHDYRAYDYLLTHWAANGFIAASIHLVGQTATDRAKVLFEHIGKLKTKFGAKAQNNIGIMGHSRGGEGVATVPRLNQQGSLGHDFRAVISLAPTNQHVDEHIVPPWATPYYVIYGSLDGDVTGEGAPSQGLLNSGFALYDKADGESKAMLFVYGATHDRFLTAPSSPDLDYGWLTPADQAKALSATAHQAIARAYMTAYFRQQLLLDPQYEELFKGEWVPPSVATADAGKAKLFSQYRAAPADRKTIDDFEGTHTATSWQSSTIGGTLSHTGLVANPLEDSLHLADLTYSPHDTSGLVPRWNSSGDRLELTIPSNHKDMTSFRAISFRVTQKYDPTGTINPVDLDQDFYVLLHDLLAHERAVKVSKFGRIPYPFVRETCWYPNGNTIKSALCTIRIPLHAFTIECAGAPRVDLSQVDKLAFVFQFASSGEVEIDDIELTQ